MISNIISFFLMLTSDQLANTNISTWLIHYIPANQMKATTDPCITFPNIKFEQHPICLWYLKRHASRFRPG